MKIIVDAMGGDNAPEEIVKGALEAVREENIEVILAGRGEDILRSIEKMGLKELPRGVEIVNASEVIAMDEDPLNAVRNKKDSSLTVALNLLRDGRGDALVSAGSTGAIVSGATFVVKRVRGIRRAALAPLIPNTAEGFILIDCGAYAECKPEYLLQFAFMGSYYAEDMLKIESPRIGLLNNGTEPSKGTPLQLEAYKLLEKAGEDGDINFVGNVEARGAMLDECDVLVCDGFSGNVFLKSAEGMASFILTELAKIFTKNIATLISGLIVKKQLRKMRARLDSDKIGGTMLLGISKPVIKAHGSSNATAIANAIRAAVTATEADTAARLQMNIDRMKIDDADDKADENT
ncbi:MAG: phosphate acyltransferase PlsX [Oscillospiraceae bacterium]|nr:phosphate acyltransferase PlsX [Oscillospiraceae bacterium]